MKLLKNFYDMLDKILSAIIAIIMMLITFEVFVQVIFRYVLHQSLGGFEELPVYMLISCVWLGGVLVAKHDNHVRIDLVTQSIKSDKRKALLNMVTSLLTAICSGAYAVLDYQFVMNAVKHNTLSSGLRFPLWYIYAITFVSSVLATVFFLINSVKEVRRLFK